MGRQWRWKMAVFAALTGGAFNVMGEEATQSMRSSDGWRSPRSSAATAKTSKAEVDDQIELVAYPSSSACVVCPPVRLACPPATNMVRPAPSTYATSTMAPGTSAPSMSAPGASADPSMMSAPASSQLGQNFSPASSDFSLGGAGAAASANAAVNPNMIGDFFGVRTFAVSNGQVVSASTPGQQISRLKQAEATNPIPQDRLFFNYNHFNDAFDSFTVNRFTFGIEKTFLNGMSSVEVRIPTAQSLSSTVDQNGADEFDLGNISTTLKALLFENCHWKFSTGLGVQLPTTNDTIVVLNGNGAPSLRIKDEAIHLLPFLGAVFTPNDRWVAQTFLQGNFDATGNAVQVQGISGKLQSQNLLFLSQAIGYHLYVNPCRDGWINQITPLVEVHYSQTINDADIVLADGGNFVTAGNGGRFNAANNSSSADLSSLNMTLGSMFVLGQNSALTLGWVLPISTDDNRQFTWEGLAQLNIFYGKSRHQQPTGIYVR